MKTLLFILFILFVWFSSVQSTTTSHHSSTTSTPDILSFNVSFYWSGGAPTATSDSCGDYEWLPSFACNSWWDNGGDWHNGTGHFEDPFRFTREIHNYVLSQVIVYVYGRLKCGFLGSYENSLSVSLQGSEIAEWNFRDLSPCYLSDGNCADSALQYSSEEIPSGWPNYNYNGDNILQVNASDGTICLSRVDLELVFTREILPISSPSESQIPIERIIIIVSITVGGALLILIGLVSYLLFKKYQFQAKYEPINDDETPRAIKDIFYSASSPKFQINGKELKLGKRVGKGSYGDVYRAEWRGILVAVKKLPVSLLQDQAFLRDFKQEVSIMSALRHPNVIQFLGSCFIENDLALITEYMENGSVYRLLHDSNFQIDYKLVKSWAMQTAQGMLYLHQSIPPVLHRDLKSQNLLVDGNLKVKISDFGLSKVVDHLNRTMTACGTAAFAAPEVLRNTRYTEKADVYSFGVCLWEFFTRTDPYEGMPTFQVIFAVGTEGMRPTIPSECPQDYADLTRACWDADPQKRPSFEEVVNRIKDLA